MPRMTPMGDNTDDSSTLRDSPKQFGHAAYGSNVPFFYTRYGSPVDLVGLYHGAACFLVSNGPSLLNLDLELLKRPGVMTMSLNNGAATLLQQGITPDFWMCVDQPSRFVRQIWLNPGIQKFIPMASFDKDLWDNEEWKPLADTLKVKYPRDCPNVLGFRRNDKFAAHRFFTEASFNWGCHQKWGGCRTVLLPAIRIPYMLGFRRLYLLGVDLHMTAESCYHFEEGRTKGAVNGNESTYRRIVKEYGPGIRAAADKLGYSIYNCNPASGLTCFEHKPFAEAIEAEAGLCGPTGKVGTAGMYIEWAKKHGTTRQQALELTGAAPKPPAPPKDQPPVAK